MAGKDNPAVLEAMKRAQEIASRITGGGGGNSFPLDDSRKRGPDVELDAMAAKKPMPGPGGVVDPKALAQTALAKMGIPPIMGQQSITVDIKIPDSLVGLVIGRGGESIQRMQSEAGAKIQVAPDGSAINGERVVTITGSPDKVELARRLVEDVVAKNKEEVNPDTIGQMDAGNSEAMMILSSRVGLIIGKGGEMIKTLSERSGCKLQMIQDGPWLTASEKPLKITGERENRMRAREMVLNLIASKEGGGTGPTFGTPSGPGGGGLVEEFSVPAPKCGVIIGRGGETIRMLQQQSGAHIELSRAPPPTPDQRIFIIKGTPPQIDAAKNLMNQKLDMQFVSVCVFLCVLSALT
jgi:far upstream element-binding protein